MMDGFARKRTKPINARLNGLLFQLMEGGSNGLR
jgi:hypothetical protein